MPRTWVLVPRANRYFRDTPQIEDKKFAIERLEFSKNFSAEYKAAIKYLFERCVKGYGSKTVSSDSVIMVTFSLREAIYDELEDGLPLPSGIKNKIEDMYEGFFSMFQDWILFVDSYIFDSPKSGPSKAVKYVNCVKLNECGVIDYGETAKRLLADTKLDNSDKLKIACVHCLENEVRGITKKVNFANTFPETCHEGTTKIMQFWKNYLKNDKYRENVEELVHAVDSDNESGLRFFWDKLSVGQRCYALPIIFADGSTYLHCTWLNEMTANEQLNILSKCGGRVLLRMKNSFVWGDYLFLVAFFAREVISDDGYFAVISGAGNEIMDDYYKGCEKNRMVLHTIWEYAPPRAKRYFYQQEDVEFMFHYLRKVYDFDFLRQVVAGGTAEFKKRFFHSEEGLQIISYLTCNGYFDEFNKLYKAAFTRVDDAVDYKIKFVNSEVGFITILQDSMYPRINKNKFDEMMKKIFITDKAANKFKKQFLFQSPYLDIFGELTRRVFYLNERKGQFRKSLDFEEILVVVRWFLGTRKEIEVFKTTKLCYIKDVKKTILEIIEKGAYDLTDEFLKWCFNDDADKIGTYKESLFGDEVKDKWHEMVFNMMQKDGRFEAMNGLVNWVNTEETQRIEFKKIIAGSFAKMRHLLKYLLYEGRFDIADTFLAWCGINSSEEVIEYKKELFDGINWRKMVSENLSRFCFTGGDGNMDEAKAQKCMKIIDWLGSAIDDEKKAEFKKKCDDNAFRDSDLEYDDDDDNDDGNDSS